MAWKAAVASKSFSEFGLFSFSPFLCSKFSLFLGRIGWRVCMNEEGGWLVAQSVR